MALGVNDAGDFVHIWGANEVELAVKGIRGDQATAAVAVNCVPRVVQHQPGLLTMKDIALPILLVAGAESLTFERSSMI